MYNKAVGVGNVDYQLFSIWLHHFFDWELSEILCFIIGNLLPVHGKRLVKVAITVQQSYGTKINVAV